MPPLLNHLPSTAKMDVAFAFTSQKRVVKDFLLKGSKVLKLVKNKIRESGDQIKKKKKIGLNRFTKLRY